MTTNIQETINRLRELDKNASPAPWSVVRYSGLEYYGEKPLQVDSIRSASEIVAEQLGCHACDEGLQSDRIENFEYIVEARNAIPVLLAEIERLTAENRNISEAWEDGYADAICDVEGAYEIDRAEITATENPYKETK